MVTTRKRPYNDWIIMSSVDGISNILLHFTFFTHEIRDFLCQNGTARLVPCDLSLIAHSMIITQSVPGTLRDELVPYLVDESKTVIQRFHYIITKMYWYLFQEHCPSGRYVITRNRLSDLLDEYNTTSYSIDQIYDRVCQYIQRDISHMRAVGEIYDSD